MQDIYKTFEFYKIQEGLLEQSKTEVGRRLISDLVMFESYNEVYESLEDLKEISSLIQRYGPLPISPSLDALRIIDDAKKALILTPRDLDMIAEDVLTSLSLMKFIAKVGNLYPRISNKIASFCDLSPLEKEIHRVINSAQGIYDKASPTLYSIRSKLKKVEALLQDKIANLSVGYTSYLSDNSITIREGHFVLPVKTAFKNKVPGIVYDVSDSGNTTFIEPLEVVQINNELTSLKVQENEEIRKILKALTNLCLLQEGEIITNNQIIGELDFLSTKAIFGQLNNCEIAEFVKEPCLELIDARHPLIDPNKVVSNSYKLDSTKRIVIISGPNAGGKTVSLKTVGMHVLMNQCGLMIPVVKAKLGYFNHIYVDIGDNQSLSDNLSTFSAHMSQIAEIVLKAGGKDLILIDELGTGTDPKEGEALALSIIKYFEHKHVFAFISSHFSALKEYAFVSEHIDNSCMIFDEKNLLPTYRFVQGMPGKSYALDVAGRYGIPEQIVKDSKDYIESKDETSVSEIMDALSEQTAKVNKLEKALKDKEDELAKKEKRLNVEETNLTKRREKLLEDVKAEKASMIKKAKEEIDYYISQLSKSDLKLHEIIEIRKKLDELEEEEIVEEFDDEIQVGDFVTIPSLDLSGKVDRINGKKAHVSCDNGMGLNVEIKNLKKIQKPKEPAKVASKRKDYVDIINVEVSLELNIIGLHVEEAMYEVKKYIANCRLKNFKTVRIIHGFGSGALRKAVHEYLRKEKGLTFRLGGEYEGGGGATVVTFND